MKKLIFIFFGVFLFAKFFCQIVSKNNNVAISFGVVPKHETEYLVPTINFIYAHALPFFNRRLSTGISAETHFTKYKHYSVGWAFIYAFPSGLSMSAAPGIIYTVQYDKIKPMLQLESSWMFNFKWIGTGPTIEYSYSPGDSHMMMGITVCKDF